MKVIFVEWRDANQILGGWTSYDHLENHDLATIETAGFLSFEDDDKIVIIQSNDDGDNFIGAFAIPKSCIVKRKEWNA